MRLRAVLGGLLVVFAVALWHRAFVVRSAAEEAEDFGCRAGDALNFCGAVAGLSTALRNPLLHMARAHILPPAETPGAVDPAITQSNIDTTICRPGFARSARPSYALTGPLKRQMMDAQYPGGRMAGYELDHLIPISLGGAPFDRRDLWLQPRQGQANAGDKNVLAYVLWRMVCERRVPLETAQRAISRDWTQAYAIYATPENVTRYHFRHSEDERD